MQHAGLTGCKRGSVFARFKACLVITGTASAASTTGFHAEQLHCKGIGKGVEDADGVAAATDAGDDEIRQATFLRQDLLARLATDDGLEIAHDAWVGVRPDGRADQVERRL